MSNAELQQNDEKKQGEFATEVPKQMMSSWDGDSMSNPELQQGGEKKRDDVATETPKQMMSSWDSEMVMVEPQPKKGRAEGGNELDKRSAK
ncbi:MAG: hypothetical protein HETSPECPRED_002393 [Heterodermia speciosa]|uniref:Uncharacterized protein n=1 Tax=Heterodermia speciosa TaxID=116794 RepID=A0A8H3J434_9LECA|nr:MAG: hypothetical protein HETSPECPRED_002393 [Heterodermia speciosa]